jgi:glycosyltransferase involved in cell wall biosynthesis
MRPLRIVHLLQSASRVYGAERCALLELETLRRRGHDARAVIVHEARLGPEEGALQAALEARGVPVERVEAAGPASPGLLLRLGAALRRGRPQLVHSHGLKTDVLGFLVSRPLRLPFLVEVHGWLRPENDRRVRLYEALDRQVLRRCEGAIVLSRDYEAELRALGVRPHLLPSGIDIDGPDGLRGRAGRRDLRGELGLPPGARVAGIVARLSPEKGHGDFLRALAAARPALDGAGAPLYGLVIGDGPLRAALEEEAARLGLAERVRFAGYVAEVADAYRALDLLVSCSRYEGLPLCLMEAMAMGRPVLSMATGGCADIVADGETGRLVPRGDGAALAAALGALLADPGALRRMGEAGLARARARYSLDAWAAGAEAVYEAVLS